MKSPLATLALIAVAACSQNHNDPDRSSHAALAQTPLASTQQPSAKPLYRDVAQPLQARVDDLVARMSLAEKIAQLYNEAPAIERLGIAEYNWWNEALHGVARAGKATVFPQAIGLAATFDDALLHQVAEAIADEARAKHHYFTRHDVVFRYTGLTFWSPNVNIFRDPRWGRGQETYGEDPYLTGRMAVAFIKGLQGDHPKYLKTAAMAKHYAVHSGPEKSRHSDDYQATPKTLHETYLPAFEMAVTEADVESVMCAYNRVNGIPACGHRELLHDILREKWGFDGHVVSDCGAVADFFVESAHHVVFSPAEAAAWALTAGTDLNCGTYQLSTFTALHFALQRGLVAETDIDRAVKRLMTTRFKLGMFDPPEKVPYTDIPMSVVGSAPHQALAQRTAEQSLVLLKNDGTLPLPDDARVAVIGPNATNPSVLVGNYHGEPVAPVLPLAGIRARAGTDRVTYAPGSALVDDQYGHFQVVPAQVLFHRDETQQLLPGLIGRYYGADLSRLPVTFPPEFDAQTTLDPEPAFVRTDANIDFYWTKSPVDEKVRGEFGVQWRGVLVPAESGRYRFKSIGKITLNGEPVTGPIELQANQSYPLEVSRVFLRTWWGNPLEAAIDLRWVNTSRDFVAEAVAAAEQADVIVFTGGISAELEGEEMEVQLTGFDGGDRTDIRLPKAQRELLRSLHKLGKPIVLVNFSGSAMALNWEHENLNAIVQAFYPGEATGTALANMLWGDRNPSGRLPITFYRGVDELPDFKDYSFANRTYRFYQGEVLYPFGHGLSYTQFDYRNLQVGTTPGENPGITLSVDVTNTGRRDGAEIVQVYARYADAPVRVPLKELKAFKRVFIKAGETQTVEVTIPAKQLRYVDDQGRHQTYRGDLRLTVGSGQAEYLPPTQFAETTFSRQ